jgi:tetratricopeptide (TPR) repeat protein
VSTYLTLLNIEYALLAAGASERALPYVRRVEALVNQETTPLATNYGLAFAANGYALAGDLGAARGLLARLDALVDSTGLHPSGAEAHVRAVIALQENRPEDALEHLRGARRDAFGLLREDARLMLGDTYAALGRWPEAAANYDTLTRSFRVNFMDQGLYASLRPLAHERAASAYLTLKDTTAALKHLNEFVEFWQNADPELQPRVESARRLMSELVREHG